MKNIDEWVEWMTRNPELAEKYYPELMQGLSERIKNSEPYLTALIIQKLPDHFPKWKTEAEQYFGIKKTKVIQGYINLINAVLTEYEYCTEIEQQAVESVRAELTEQLEYWNIELKALPPQPISVNESRTKKLIFETITNIDKQGWQYAFVSELDYNLFTDLLTNFFEYKPYTLPETTIQLKRTCKTKVAKALGEIHKVLSNENKLSTDTEYFKIIRVLNHFKNETEGDLYKALTR
jgi:hypothetical protein